VIEEKGENARLSAFVGAIAVGDLVKSTLGPKGMDKILQSAYVGWSPGLRGGYNELAELTSG
jgi:T-complex protein 1 subunit beta